MCTVNTVFILFVFAVGRAFPGASADQGLAGAKHVLIHVVLLRAGVNGANTHTFFGVLYFVFAFDVMTRGVHQIC